MKVYVASSWRNEQQPALVLRLRDAGHVVYDFRDPHRTGPDRGRAGRGFHWSEIDPDWQGWSPERFRAALEHPLARDGFASDMDALRWCDVCVLLLPCGRSAHLELGCAAGAGKRTAILLSDGEPELMYRMAHSVCTTVTELVHRLDDWS